MTMDARALKVIVEALNDRYLTGSLTKDAWINGLRGIDDTLAASGMTWEDLNV